MSEPRQFRRDQATGGFAEDRLTESPMPLSVCPNCSAYYIGPRCASCGWTEAASMTYCGNPKCENACGRKPPEGLTGVHSWVDFCAVPVRVPVDEDDAAEPDSPTDLDVSDPPGGSD